MRAFFYHYFPIHPNFAKRAKPISLTLPHFLLLFQLFCNYATSFLFVIPVIV